MASKDKVESWSEEAVCPICLDFFTDPVTLECGHNFCCSCITQSWGSAGTNSCPECREEIADRSLKVNRALARLSEKARALSLNTEEKGSKLFCEEHQEEMKLFCENDKKLICLVCRDALEHRNHSFKPIKEAVDIYKARVKSDIESVTKNKSDIEEIEQQQLRKISKVREESHSLQPHVTSQFAELHQIITEKEKYFLKDIREDEQRILNLMERNLREIQENLNSTQEELLRLQERMEQKDSVKFLEEEAVRKRRISDEIHSLSVTDGAITAEKFNHLFLLKAALIETFDSIKQVSVTLDMETAHALLEVSEDRKRVRWTGTRRSLPDTGKRFTGSARVLGSEGFTSGRHYWEVEVAGSEGWGLGVAAESVERKGRGTLTPETGVWRIRRRDDAFVAFTSPRSRLPARPIPGRVGVYLSYESGTVSFYDAGTKSHLHTFTGNKFTEKLYPFFETWDADQWLRICSGSHQIITEKEKYFLKDIREDEERILNLMEKNARVKSAIESVTKNKSDIEEIKQQQLRKISGVWAVRKRRITDEVNSLSVTDGAITAVKLNHLFLLKTVLTEAFDSFKQVSVTLDVETASPWLEVSEDRKRVRFTGARRSLPDTGNRFTGSACVLGSEGFTSGRHYWEVVVAWSRRWSLGVAAESVERQGEDTPTPETGVWSIWRRSDEFEAVTSPLFPLPVRPIPGRVGVYLSYESGTVSFYDADTKSHLHTFTGNKFTDKLYPFFAIWDENHWLRICSGSAPCQ
ncbi:E3 ubiquitin-protein ligase TRIM21-like [Rhinoraja longicauda]